MSTQHRYARKCEDCDGIIHSKLSTGLCSVCTEIKRHAGGETDGE